MLKSFYNILLNTLFPNTGKLTHAVHPHPREFTESYEDKSCRTNHKVVLR